MFLGVDIHSKYRPAPNDSVRELRWKAESMLELLLDNEADLRRFPSSAVDQRLELWRGLTGLLARAAKDSALSLDAQLEAHRVWAEEMRLAALNIVTLSVLARTPAAQQRFAQDPDTLDDLIDRLDHARPAALNVLSREDLDRLRAEGFL